MKNRIDILFKKKKNNILSIYFTAGFPKLNDTTAIIEELQKSGADMIEIGIPFSDPLADGPIIQRSSEIALKNGMNLNLLFKQLLIADCQLPTLLMGYLNPVLQFGIENFCKKCFESGIDGTIIPDLPVGEYQNHYKKIFEKYNLKNIFLITPQTSEERIRMIDEISEGFIYAVSSSSTTGGPSPTLPEGKGAGTLKYFERINNMKLKNPVMIGFGISDRKSFQTACKYANGAIIGSAFIKAIENGNLKQSVRNFVKKSGKKLKFCSSAISHQSSVF